MTSWLNLDVPLDELDESYNSISFMHINKIINHTYFSSIYWNFLHLLEERFLLPRCFWRPCLSFLSFICRRTFSTTLFDEQRSLPWLYNYVVEVSGVETLKDEAVRVGADFCMVSNASGFNKRGALHLHGLKSLQQKEQVVITGRFSVVRQAKQTKAYLHYD